MSAVVRVELLVGVGEVRGQMTYGAAFVVLLALACLAGDRLGKWLKGASNG